jgi:hypothetical protein
MVNKTNSALVCVKNRSTSRKQKENQREPVVVATAALGEEKFTLGP